jgi:cytochrome P450
VTLLPPLASDPLRRVRGDLAIERRARRTTGLPPGPTSLSVRRTYCWVRNALPLMLEAYREYGPVFTVRILHGLWVLMIGPEANHYMTVSHASKFRWRDGGMGELRPLVGDGLLTIDGETHRRARRTMNPAFHHRQIAIAGESMVEETLRALAPWRVGDELDLYDWTRALALRIALRALFGVDPDRADESGAAEDFERALSFYRRDLVVQALRGPGTPWATLHRARGRLDSLFKREIDRRRSTGERGADILSLLLDARDEEGDGFDDDELRDHVMTLLFAGHDTTTSTVAFLFYELARHPTVLERLYDEQDRVLGRRVPASRELVSDLPELQMAIDETLRLYPPAWTGPRRAVETFEFGGHIVPAGMLVNYSSWASHHLAEVFPEPEAFRPERMPAEAKKSCRRAPTCRSAAARAPASECASACSRSRRSPRSSSSVSVSRWNQATTCARARCRRSARGTACR